MPSPRIGLDKKKGIRFGVEEEFLVFGVNLTEDILILAGGVRINGVERPVHWDLQGPPRVEEDGRLLRLLVRPRVDPRAAYAGEVPVPREDGASTVTLVYPGDDEDATHMEITYDLKSVSDQQDLKSAF